MPTEPETLTGPVSSSAQTKTALTSRRASRSASSTPRTPRASTTNSSPPKRKTASSARSAPRSRSATANSTASPARCPSVSLIRLKSSRSRNATARSPPEPASSELSTDHIWVRLGRPVSMSWCARYAISSSSARSSVMSSSVPTKPTPWPGSGTAVTCMRTRRRSPSDRTTRTVRSTSAPWSTSPISATTSGRSCSCRNESQPVPSMSSTGAPNSVVIRAFTYPRRRPTSEKKVATGDFSASTRKRCWLAPRSASVRRCSSTSARVHTQDPGATGTQRAITARVVPSARRRTSGSCVDRAPLSSPGRGAWAPSAHRSPMVRPSRSGAARPSRSPAARLLHTMRARAVGAADSALGPVGTLSTSSGSSVRRA